ncbi:hypothetical protein OS493_005293 [Desmophyllum pertusum]|uniref:Sulfotransferase n=1 Tax=Desmophyllum pertusum TaxID=174260 RepID=A0A9W9Z7P2_9CNID|nr:hypothetical protein OS493_005293 [Desmophyllum pertusum]
MAPRIISFRLRAVACLICISTAIFGLILQFYRSEKVIACEFQTRNLDSGLMTVSTCNCNTVTAYKDSDFLDVLLEDTPPPPCKPVNNILFLKTHKTGSSTVTNILNRYGDTRDLMFALPSIKVTYSFFWPRPFQLRFTQAFGRAPNILCNHARYNKIPMNWLFPKETTRYITLLREPSQHFESIFNFFQLGRRFLALRKVSSPLETFLQNSTYYLQQATNITGLLNLIRNPALFDLGLDPKYHRDLTVVRNYIRFLQQEFDLVLLVEYFDESLVLLKRRFLLEN